MFMASIIVIFYLSLLLGKCVHFESSTQLCLPRRKTEQFLLGEPHSGHIRATVTAAKLFCCCVANSAVSEGDHPVFKKKKERERERKTKQKPEALSVWNCDFATKKKNPTQQATLCLGWDGTGIAWACFQFWSLLPHTCRRSILLLLHFATKLEEIQLQCIVKSLYPSSAWGRCVPSAPQSSPCPHKRLNSTELCVLKIEIQKKSLLSQNLTVFFFISSPVCI